MIEFYIPITPTKIIHVELDKEFIARIAVLISCYIIYKQL